MTYDAGDDHAYMDALRTLVTSNRDKVVAIGECGLDYDRLEFCPQDLQMKYFRRQVQLAVELRMPLFLHNRNTGGDFLEVMRAYRDRMREAGVGGVVHSFDGSMEEMKALTGELGLFIGVNGCSMKTEENVEVVRAIPMEYLLVETDAPW